MKFAKKLYDLRKSAGLSQKELANKLDVAQASINYWEKGQREPSITAARKIAEFFNISLDTLLGLDEMQQEYDNKKSNLERLQQYYYSLENNDGEEIIQYMNELETLKLNELAALEDNLKFTRGVKEGWLKILPNDEEPLIDAYRLLNELGKKEAIKRVEELTEIPRYKKPDEN